MRPQSQPDATTSPSSAAASIGLAVAWRAAQRGLRVIVLDARRAGAGASRVAAGMLAPVTEAELGERALLALGLRERARAGRLRAELRGRLGLDPATARAARSSSRATATRPRRSTASSRSARALGLPVERLLPSAGAPPRARARADAAARARRPRRPRVDPRALVAALAAALRRRRGRAGAPGDRGRARGAASTRRAARTAASGCSPAQVVVAAGALVGALAGLPATPVPVRPVKGQILRLRDPRARRCSTRVVRCEGGYLVPRGDGRYVLGATMEERGFDTAVTARRVYELLRDAAELVPGVLELEVERGARRAAPGHARQRPDPRPRASDGAASGPPATTATASCSTPRHRRRSWRRLLAGERPTSALAPFAPARFVREVPRDRQVNGEPSELPAGATVADAAGHASTCPRAPAASRSPSTPRSSRAASGPPRWPTAPASRSSPRCREADGHGAHDPPGRRSAADRRARATARGCCSARAASRASRRWPTRSARAGPSW